jgi:TM2 domain-containing membrane protein YozV
MKCANHPEVDSTAFCGYCGRPMCTACRHEVRGMSYCESCLAVRLQPSTLPPIIGLGGGPSPGVALALGFIPGVGAIYNGQVVKAITQVLIFGSLWAVAERAEGGMGALFVIGTLAFYFYMVIDSFQTAKRKAMGLPTEEWFGLGDMKMNAPIGAALLIGLGALFLLDNLGLPVFRHMGRFWPVLLILIGVAMLQKRMRGGGPPTPPHVPPTEPPREGPGSYSGPLNL